MAQRVSLINATTRIAATPAPLPFTFMEAIIILTICALFGCAVAWATGR